MKEVTIYCDGSSLGNGLQTTRAADVAILGYGGLWRAAGTFLGEATNQQAAIAAGGNGLQTTRAAAVAILGYRGLWRAAGTFLGEATNQQAEIAAAAIGLESLRE